MQWWPEAALESSSEARVTAYVPCYNAAESLEASLEGLLAQTYAISEILVVDDGSTDRTAQVARRFPVRVIRHDRNRGLAAARNTAIRESRYSFIASVDADVVPTPSWLEELMSAMTESHVAGAGGKCYEHFQESAADRWRAMHLIQDLGAENLEITPSMNSGLSGFAAVFRKSALERVGGYNEQYLTNFEDWDISVRLRAAGYTLMYHTAALAVHMRRDTAMSVVRTAWRWVFWIRYRSGLYDKPGRKFLDNLRRATKKAQRHLRRQEYSLLPIDCLYLACFCYWDLRYFLGRKSA